MSAPTPTCTARVYGCPATPDWSQWQRAQLADTGLRTVALVVVGVLLILIGLALLWSSRGGGHE